MGTAAIRFTAVPITSYYGKRILQSTGAENFHEGVDTATGGNYAHSAFATGIVIASPQMKKDRVRGWYIEYEVENCPGLTISHHSLLRPARIKKGQKVYLGDIIGFAGESAMAARGNHVHNGMWFDGKHVDPLKYLIPGQVVSFKYPTNPIPPRYAADPSKPAATLVEMTPNGVDVFIVVRNEAFYLAIPAVGFYTLVPLAREDVNVGSPKQYFKSDTAWRTFLTKVTNKIVLPEGDRGE